MKQTTKNFLEKQIQTLTAEAARVVDQADHTSDGVESQLRYAQAAAHYEVVVELRTLIDGDTVLVAESAGIGGRTVQHLDTPESEEPAGLIPAHVWMSQGHLTDFQKRAYVGFNAVTGLYAVAVDDLTNEQREIFYAVSQLQNSNK